jgi:hypothetical protein
VNELLGATFGSKCPSAAVPSHLIAPKLAQSGSQATLQEKAILAGIEPNFAMSLLHGQAVSRYGENSSLRQNCIGQRMTTYLISVYFT